MLGNRSGANSSQSQISSLTAWIDHMVLSGRTVGHGLVDDTCVIITSAYQERHLAAFLGLIGLTEFSFARAPTRAVADSDPGAADFVPFLRQSRVIALHGDGGAEVAQFVSEFAEEYNAPTVASMTPSVAAQKWYALGSLPARRGRECGAGHFFSVVGSGTTGRPFPAYWS